MEVSLAWDVVEPRVKHNSCDMLKEWAKSNCLIMFLDGTGASFSSGPALRRCGCGVGVLDFTDVFAPSLVFGRGGGLFVAEQIVPRSGVHAGIQVLRYALRKTPLVLISDNEYSVSTGQRGRANPVGRFSDLWHRYWVAVEYHAAAILIMKVKSRAGEGLRQEAVACLAAKPHVAYRGVRRMRLDAETQYEDDEPRTMRAVFDNGDEVQKSALHPRLGAVSVHEGRSIFHHKGVLVCVKCGQHLARVCGILGV